MKREVGELRVDKVDGQPVVRQADPLIYVHQEFLDEWDGTSPDGQSFTIAGLRYRVLGAVPELPGSVLCERVA